MKRKILTIGLLAIVVIYSCSKNNSATPTASGQHGSSDNGNAATTKVTPQTFTVNGASLSYDDVNHVLVRTSASNDNQGYVETLPGTDTKIELDGITHATIANSLKGYLILTVSSKDTTFIKYSVYDTKGTLTAEYHAIIRAGGEIGVIGASLTSFTDASTLYDAAYVAKVAATNTQTIAKVNVRDE